MESLNLSSVHSTRVDSRKPEGSAVSLPCASCGSKENDQTDSFKSFLPGIPSSIPFPEKCEENYSFHQPVFTNPPFFQPFLNNSIAPNFYFPYNNLNPFHNFASISESLKHTKIENEKLLQQPSPFGGFLFCPMEKANTRQPDHTKESQQTQSGQKCSCNNLTPWNFSPYVVPIISYYVLWNSQRSNIMPLASSSSCSQTENLPQKRTEDKMCECSTHVGDNKSSYVDGGQVKNDEIKFKEEIEEDHWAEDKLAKSERRASSQIFQNSSLMSFNNFIEENGYNVDSKPEIKESLEESKFEEIDTEKILANFEKELGDTQSINTECYCYSEFLNTKMAEEESDSQNKNKSEELEFYQDLKKSNIESDLGNSLQFSDIPSEELKLTSVLIPNDQLKEKESDEDLMIKSAECDNLNIKDRISKKMIKNFTMTNQDCEVSENSETTNSSDAAAAGDLGGITCISYKINISPNNSETWKIRQETQTEENMAPKDLLEGAKEILENLEIEENSKSKILSESTSTNYKSPRNFKSGIAKLSNNYRFRDYSTDVSSISTAETKELLSFKYKFQNNESSENSLRLHKVRNSTTLEQTQCLDKSTKRKTGMKSSGTKKEEKVTVKNHPCGNVEKRGKSVSKK